MELLISFSIATGILSVLIGVVVVMSSYFHMDPLEFGLHLVVLAIILFVSTVLIYHARQQTAKAPVEAVR